MKILMLSLILVLVGGFGFLKKYKDWLSKKNSSQLLVTKEVQFTYLFSSCLG